MLRYSDLRSVRPDVGENITRVCTEMHMCIQLTILYECVRIITVRVCVCVCVRGSGEEVGTRRRTTNKTMVHRALCWLTRSGHTSNAVQSRKSAACTLFALVNKESLYVDVGMYVYGIHRCSTWPYILWRNSQTLVAIVTAKYLSHQRPWHCLGYLPSFLFDTAIVNSIFSK